jgi:hypothetical protein
MEDLLMTGVVGVIGAAAGALTTYFFSTKNLESIVSEQSTICAERALKIHNEIEHKENNYDIVDERIKRHREECGLRVDKFMEKAASGIQRLELEQVKVQTVLITMSRTIGEIANKLNIVQRASQEDLLQSFSHHTLGGE